MMPADLPSNHDGPRNLSNGYLALCWSLLHLVLLARMLVQRVMHETALPTRLRPIYKNIRSFIINLLSSLYLIPKETGFNPRDDPRSISALSAIPVLPSLRVPASETSKARMPSYGHPSLHINRTKTSSKTQHANFPMSSSDQKLF